MFVTKYDTNEEKEYKVDLPPKGFGKGCFFNFGRSEGFIYCIEHYHKALDEGKLFCEEWTQDESLRVMRIMDEARHQLGFYYPDWEEVPSDK